MLNSRFEMNPKTRIRQDKIITKDQPKLWKHQGPGFVYILPSLSDTTCQVSKPMIINYVLIFYVILTTYLLVGIYIFVTRLTYIHIGATSENIYISFF